MSKAENYIRNNTNQFSNEDGFDYVPWLTPDQARRAVEIAREEIYFYIESMVSDITFSDVDGNDNYDLNKFIDDLKQAMKDE